MPWNIRLAVVVFFLIAVGSIVAFGAVDRAIQIPLTALLAIGLMLQPPKLMQTRPWMHRVILAVAIILVAKELLPATWFGVPAWRTTIHDSFGVTLPATHHPEPGRALDAWLVGVVGFVWFLWVRGLAVEREDRAKVAWGLFLAAVVAALVSFGFSKASPTSIFGMRYTPEWFGFGPFPNRNHTADLLAMGIVMGAGCAAHAGSRKRYDFMCTAVLAMAVLMAALLKTQSRGGLLALGLGLLLFLALVVAKIQSKKAIAVAVAVVLLVGGFALVAGGKTLARFTDSDRLSDDSSAMRVAIWRDTMKMWRDAPLLGVGAGAYASVFPFYQDLTAENVTVRHPESSLLQWAVEIGAIPMVIGGVLVVVFAVPHVRNAFGKKSSFYLAAGGFAAVGVLLVHSWIDVPGHRWGTAAFALAAMAVACPASYDARASRRVTALVPLTIAGVWTLPVLLNGPAWSPFQLDRTLSAGAVQPLAYRREVEAALHWFPLNPKLRLLHAQILELSRAPASQWQSEYRVAARLLPSSWRICAQIAQHCRGVSPTISLHYWQMAVERASMHRFDAFREALSETAGIPSADVTWQSYLEVNPDLALAYGETKQGGEGRAYYEFWWAKRGSRSEVLAKDEINGFLRLAERWGTADQLSTWMKLHGERRDMDTRRVVSLLHSWKADAEAWNILSAALNDPEYPLNPPRGDLSQLEQSWISNPADVVNARNYAQLLDSKGEREKAEDVVLRTAKLADAPKWFLEKGAHVLARKQQYREAVELALRVPAS